MRFLVGYQIKNKKAFATITTSREEVDYQFWYPGRNRVIKEYKNVNDIYSWNDEDGGELVYTEPAKIKCSPRISDLRTPFKKSKENDDNTSYCHPTHIHSSKKQKGVIQNRQRTYYSGFTASKNVQGQASKNVLTYHVFYSW